MLLRVSPIGPGLPTRQKLDGRLTAEEAPKLRRACAELKGRVVLDLTDLQFADRQGVSALRELSAQGAELIGDVVPVAYNRLAMLTGYIKTNQT